jgi:hypothetical protein
MLKINRIGERFGRLKVIAESSTIKGRAHWKCVCDCGKEKIIAAGALSTGMTSSCGCLGREKTVERNTKHGKAQRGSRRNLEYTLWVSAKGRAKRQGRDFTISLSEVIIPLTCPILGTPLSVGTRGSHDNSPSLDRRDSTLGYVSGNVWVISYRANRIKNDASLGELELVVMGLRKALNGEYK